MCAKTATITYFFTYSLNNQTSCKQSHNFAWFICVYLMQMKKNLSVRLHNKVCSRESVKCVSLKLFSFISIKHVGEACSSMDHQVFILAIS